MIFWISVACFMFAWFAMLVLVSKEEHDGSPPSVAIAKVAIILLIVGTGLAAVDYLI